MTGIAKNTVAKLLVNLGEVCAEYHDKHVRGLKCNRIQCDEIWSFVGKKEKNVPAEQRGCGIGDTWTWTAIDAETKLIVSYMVGRRDPICAHEFMLDVADRITSHVQLTTDGLRAYLTAVENAFGNEVDYAQLIKIYGQDPVGPGRYSPPKCIGTDCHTVTGMPDPKHVSTSYVERCNLSMRMGMRRFTRLTNAFSKKVENHEHAVAIHFMHYNFCRIHQTLRVTPAMQAGLCDHCWELSDLAALVEERENAAIEKGSMKRGSYKKSNSN